MGTLYVVATPIGNLEDLSPRARRVLGAVGLIAAEDTRHTQKLLTHEAISSRLLSVHQFNEQQRVGTVLDALSRGDVALVTDAGTPGVSDPGARIVHAVRDAGHAVVPIPGPSALTAAVSASGLVDGPFVMIGFLPRKGRERQDEIKRAAATGYALVIFEAPGRVAGTLSELDRSLPGREAVVARELTKLHEEILSGSLLELAERCAETPPRGEVVIVVGPGTPERPEVDLEAMVGAALAGGERPSAAAKRIATETGRPKAEVYALALQIGSGDAKS